GGSHLCRSDSGPRNCHGRGTAHWSSTGAPATLSVARMVPVIDRASQSCLDRSDDDSCVSSPGTPQTPKPDRKALLRARRNACGVGRRCRVRRNVYLAGSGNGDPSEEGPDQTLQILDAKCSCGLVDGSFSRNCNLRSEEHTSE